MGVKLGTAVTTVVALLLGMVLTADAASIRVKCEKRANRSKISVDGFDLGAGSFTATATSGQNTATSGAKNAVAGEAEFDFDSDAGDVAEGATSISPAFIQNNTVTGSILAGATVVAGPTTVSCRVK